MRGERPLVIVPTYNERENLPTLVEQLLRIPNLRIMVVDDGSPDGTGKTADALAETSGGRLSVMHRSGPRGLGLSYVDGMREALRLGATEICQMDADLSHSPAELPRLLAAAADADLVIGSRYVEGGRIENWPLRRRLLSAFANLYIRQITKMRIRDCTTGFRCWRREALEKLPLDRIVSDGYALMVELLWEAQSARCRIAEVPITFVERREGTSKLSWRVVGESVVLPWKLAARPRPSGRGSLP